MRDEKPHGEYVSMKLRKEYETDFQSMIDKWYEVNLSSNRFLVCIEGFEWNDWHKDYLLHGHIINYNNNKAAMVVSDFGRYYSEIRESFPLWKRKKVKDKKLLKAINVAFYAQTAKALLGERHERETY
jgi:hypothetical protein